MPTPTTVRSQQDDTLDLIVYRHYGRTAGVTEVAYAANRGLSDLGPVLPINTPVLLPIVVEAPKDDGLVRLWD